LQAASWFGSRVEFLDGLTKVKFHQPSFGSENVPLQLPSALTSTRA
jgi:hypothetical protein